MLPAELRIQIWKASAHHRVLEIYRHAYDLATEPAEWYWSPQPVAAIQHTCRESRSSGCYVKAFTGGTNPRYTWVNFSTDVIEIGVFSLDDDGMEYLRIRYLRIIVGLAGGLPMAPYFAFEDFPLVYRYENVQCVWIVSTEDEDFDEWGHDFNSINLSHLHDKVFIVKRDGGEERSLAQCVQDHKTAKAAYI